MRTSRPQTGGTQTLQRGAQLLRLLATHARDGLRLLDAARLAALERPTTHRLLRGLVAEGLAMQDARTRRYFLGPLAFELGLVAARRFNLRDICHGALVRLAQASGDTVYMAVRRGGDAVCLDRCEGTFPIKTLTVDIGDRVPLGVGAGGLAQLAALEPEESEAVIAANSDRTGAYPGLDAAILRAAVEETRRRGYSVHRNRAMPGVLAIGLVLRTSSGAPVASISIAAIESRMTPRRRKELIGLMRAEAKALESQLGGPQ